MRRGDIIVSFGGQPLPCRDVIQEMRQKVYPLKQQGNVVRSIDILREGKAIQLRLRW